MTKEQRLERYEALGEERDFLAAKPLYEQALAEAPDARLLNDYGYLLYAHGGESCGKRPSCSSGRSSSTPAMTSRTGS